MFEKMIDDLKARAAARIRLTSLAAATAATAFVTFAFLCAAGFIYVYQAYGLIDACLAGAALFFFLTVLIGGYTMAQRAEAERQAARAAKNRDKEKDKSALQAALSDPLVIASALQVVRAVGLRRLLPLLAIAGAGLGLWAGTTRRAGGKAASKSDES